MSARRVGRAGVLLLLLVAWIGAAVPTMASHLGSGSLVDSGMIRPVAGARASGPGPAISQTPVALAWDGERLIVADTDYYAVRALNPATGHQQVLAGYVNPGWNSWSPLSAVAVDSHGRSHALTWDGVARIDEGGPVDLDIGFAGTSLAFDAQDRLYLVHADYHRVVRWEGHDTWTVIAGDNGPGFSGEGRRAVDAQLNEPHHLAFGPDGALYIADTGNGRVRRVDQQGTITTVAGSGQLASGCCRGDGGPAKQAVLDRPVGVSFDHHGRMLIADGRQAVVRRVDRAGVITTVAGGGSASPTEGGHATDARLGWTSAAVAVPGHGVFIAAGSKVWRVDDRGRIWTAAGTDGRSSLTGDDPLRDLQVGGLADVLVRPDGSVLVAAGHHLYRLAPGGRVTVLAGSGADSYLDPDLTDGDGGAAVDAAVHPGAVAAGPDGTLFLADRSSGRIRRIDRAGRIHTLRLTDEAGSPVGIDSLGDMVADAVGNLYISEFGEGRVYRIDDVGRRTLVAGNGGHGEDGDGGPATLASLSNPNGLAFDRNGNLLIAESGGPRIRLVDPRGRISTLLGPDTLQDALSEVAATESGEVYLDSGHRILRLDQDGKLVHVGGTIGPGVSLEGGVSTAVPLGQLTTFAWDEVGQRLLFGDGVAQRLYELDLTVTGLAVVRLAGLDRIETAVVTSRATFRDGEAHAVVLARSDDYPDALAGAPLAVAEQGPLLLTTSEWLDGSVEEEIQRVLAPGGTVYLLGGREAIGEHAEMRLDLMGVRWERLAGANRYETAVAIAERGLGTPATVLLATGTNHPDALSGAAAAAHVGGAILLTNGTTMAPATQAYLTRHRPTRRYALGGPAAAADPGARALVGRDRYETAAQVATALFVDPSAVGIVSGTNFPDALGGGARLGHLGGPLLLSDPTALPTITAGYLQAERSGLTVAELFGGPNALAPAVESAVMDALR